MVWHDELVGNTGRLLAVGAATAVICLLLLALLRVSGPRNTVPTTTVDVACMMAVGAVVGRTGLLSTPTLAGGVVSLTVLFVLHRGLSALGGNRAARRVLTRPPVVLMTDGVLHAHGLRRAHVSDDQLRQRLRLAGITCVDEVGLAVLESHGQISVLRRGGVDEWLIGDLEGLGRGSASS